MSESYLLNPKSNTKTRHKIFIFFGIVIVICIIAAGLNFQKEIYLSSIRIGADMVKKDHQIFFTYFREDGPSFKAGMKSNSYLVSINNKPVIDFIQLDAILTSKVSDLIIVTFKDGRSYSYKIKKGMPPDFSSIFIEIFISALFLLLAYISIPSRGNRSTTRNLILILLFLFFALDSSLTPFISLININTGFLDLFVLAAIFLSSIFGALTLALELHILCIVPKPRLWFINYKNPILATFYSLSVYLFFIYFLSYINYESTGIMETLFSLWALSIINILWISLILGILYIQLTKSTSSRERNQLIIIFASLLPSIIARGGIEWSYIGDTPEPLWVSSLLTFSNFSFPIGFMIAVKRYDLADLEHDIQRPIVFKFVSALIIFSLLIGLYNYFLEFPNNDLTSFLFFGISSLIFGMLWLPLSSLLNHWAANSSQSDLQASYPSLHNILDSTLAYHNNNQVATNLPRIMNNVLHSSWVAVMLKEDSESSLFHCEKNTNEFLNVELLKIELNSLFNGQNNFDQLNGAAEESISLFELGATNILPLIYRKELLGGIVLAQNSSYHILSNKVLSYFTDHLAEIIFTNKMRRLATIDGLTNILRREAILEKLYNEFAHYQETGEELSVCLLDIDHFKKVNDTYGHAAGDKALKQISKTLKALTQKSDLVGRYGGEEFLIVLPNTKITKAKIFLDYLRLEIHNNAIKISQDITLNISISSGITGTESLQKLTSGTANNLVQSLIKEADIALYQAKETGRNKVVIATTVSA